MVPVVAVVTVLAVVNVFFAVVVPGVPVAVGWLQADLQLLLRCSCSFSPRPTTGTAPSSSPVGGVRGLGDQL